MKMLIDQLPPTITVEQAGKLLGISRRSAYRAAVNGELPTIRMGRRLLVLTVKVLELLELSELPFDDRRVEVKQ